MRTCGLVLAAGRSERFGPANKLLVQFRGKPLAAHVAQAMRAVPLDHRLVVVADPDVARLFEDYEVLTPGPASEPQQQSASLALGAQRAIELAADRLLVALADMPLVDAELLETVLHHATDADPAAATDGKRAMPPACFPASRLGTLMKISGDRGAGVVLRDLPRTALVAAPDGVLADVDAPADLEKLLRGISESRAIWE